MRTNVAMVAAAAVLLLPCCVAGGQATGSFDAKPAYTGPKADIIFVHANVYTGVPANSPFSSILREEAIAVRGDRIQAVGKDFDLQKFKGPQTQVVVLGGHFVMPGFNDAHLHLADAGATKLSVDMTGVKSLDELRERLARKVEVASAGEWIVGAGWDETLWPVQAAPTRWDLDEVSNGHPVFLERIDGHIAHCNSVASLWRAATLSAGASTAMRMASLRAFCARPQPTPCST